MVKMSRSYLDSLDLAKPSLAIEAMAWREVNIHLSSTFTCKS